MRFSVHIPITTPLEEGDTLYDLLGRIPLMSDNFEAPIDADDIEEPSSDSGADTNEQDQAPDSAPDTVDSPPDTQGSVSDGESTSVAEEEGEHDAPIDNPGGVSTREPDAPIFNPNDIPTGEGDS